MWKQYCHTVPNIKGDAFIQYIFGNIFVQKLKVYLAVLMSGYKIKNKLAIVNIFITKENRHLSPEMRFLVLVKLIYTMWYTHEVGKDLQYLEKTNETSLLWLGFAV